MPTYTRTHVQVHLLTHMHAHSHAYTQSICGSKSKLDVTEENGEMFWIHQDAVRWQSSRLHRARTEALLQGAQEENKRATDVRRGSG